MITANFYSQNLYTQQVGPGPYGEYFLFQGDIQGFGIDWQGWLANHWVAGNLNAAGLVLRSTTPNGYEYACTVAGESGGVEPAWVPTIGSTVNDGAATFTCQALSTASLSTTVSSVVWTPIAGIAGSDVVVITDEQLTNQLASAVFDTTKCLAGNDYIVYCRITCQDGETKAGQFKLKVR